MNTFHPDASFDPSRTCVLGSAITAFGASPDHTNPERFGSLSELPKGAVLEIRGDGFNDHTVRVRYDDRYFAVFYRDLASAVPPEGIAGREDVGFWPVG
jgi:hypothetical protein